MRYIPEAPVYGWVVIVLGGDTVKDVTISSYARLLRLLATLLHTTILFGPPFHASAQLNYDPLYFLLDVVLHFLPCLGFGKSMLKCSGSLIHCRIGKTLECIHIWCINSLMVGICLYMIFECSDQRYIKNIQNTNLTCPVCHVCAWD